MLHSESANELDLETFTQYVMPGSSRKLKGGVHDREAVESVTVTVRLLTAEGGTTTQYLKIELFDY